MTSEQRVWYRIDLDETPQGHALARDAGEYVYYAFEDVDGEWVLWRQSRDGVSSEAVKLADFSLVREVVAVTIEASGRRANPSTEDLWRFIQENPGALVGTAVGILIGGIPGMIMNHMPVTVVGTQLGALVGGTAGTYFESRQEKQEKSTQGNKDLKRKLI